MTTRVLHAAKPATLPASDGVRARRKGRHMRSFKRVLPARTGVAASRWWPWARRILTVGFFGLVGLLLYRYASTVHWPDVLSAIMAYPWPVLMAAAVLAASSHVLYSTYDLLGRYFIQHRLRTATVMKVTFISYAFNLNLGSLIGGIAFRYRLYSRLGLEGGQVTRIVTISMLTNWLGYFVLAGAVFTFWPLALPAQWRLDEGSVQLLGMGLLAAATGYVVMCGLSTRRHWQVRGHELHLPSLRMAALQVLMSCSNWLLIAGVVYVLMPGQIGFADVLSVLLIAAVAGVITHVPAGLGVLEAVFVTLLSSQAPAGQLLAALLTYRALYYLTPFAIALVLYGVTEARKK